jgi:type I restriction enzyme S subunit
MNWATVSLGEVCDAGRGEVRTGPFGSQLHESDYSTEGTPVVMPKDIATGRVDDSAIARVSHHHVERLSQHKLSVGDIVYGRRGDIGRRALISEREEGWLCGTGCLRISPGKQAVDSQFLFYRLGEHSVVADIRNRAIGATMPNLNTTILRDTILTIPPLSMQRRIAAVLGAYDDLIEVNRRRIALLEEMARGLFEEWFVRFRFPGHENVTINETAEGPLPEGWRVTTLNDLLLERRDAVMPDEVPSDTRYVGLEHLPRRLITLNDFGPATAATSLKLRFQRGDILFGKIRPYFHKVVWAPWSGIASSDALILRPVNGDTSALVLCLVSSDAFVAHSVQTSNGTKMPRANWTVLKRYSVQIPPADLLNRFSGIVHPAVELAANLQAQNEELGAARDLLLPRLISGQLTLPSAERQVEDAATFAELVAAE